MRERRRQTIGLNAQHVLAGVTSFVDTPNATATRGAHRAIAHPNSLAINHGVESWFWQLRNWLSCNCRPPAAGALRCYQRKLDRTARLITLLNLSDHKHNALVIVPTYNERDNLPGIVEALGKLSVDLLVVDDNSPDGTGKLADELAAKHPFVHVLHREEKNGLGRAYCAGFEWALAKEYEFVLEMDGDFSHDPEDIPRFLETAEDADLVLGTRTRAAFA